MQILVSIFLGLCLNSALTARAIMTPDKYKLEQLQVIFRHGDRTPEKSENYYGNPYDEIYQSIGYGQLTKIGKKREYKIGQFLRKRYGYFLGEYQNNVYAYSSGMDRTKMSLQLVLSGLYPPTQLSSWEKFVNWQPIPTHYESLDNGFLTAPFYCSEKYDLLHKEITKAPVNLEISKRNANLIRKIKRHTGVTISDLIKAIVLYINLRSALSLALPLPSWCTTTDYDELQNIAAVGYKTITYTEQLRRLVAGPLVARLLNVLNQHDGSNKIYLYSGHDVNIASFVDAHNITGAPGIPDFGSTIILEKLRGPDDKYYVRVYLWTGVSEKLIFLKVNNCARTCPLADYHEIAQTILPNQIFQTCSISECSRKNIELN